MHLDIELPDHGEFTNGAGQKIEFWLIKNIKGETTAVKILVDGVPLDADKYEAEQEALFGNKTLD